MNYNHQIYYSDSDEDDILNHLAEYVENNNRPEYDATNINDEEFIEAPLLIPRSYTISLLKMQYGKNLINIGNLLHTQDLFFKDYMPHICKYLDLLGIDYRMSYFRPNSFTTFYMLKAYMTDSNMPKKFWDSSIEWEDLSYTDDICMNLTNPVNNFYSATLELYKIDNDNFINRISAIYNTDILKMNKSRPLTMKLKLLPCFDPTSIAMVTEAIHKYL